MNSKLVFYFTLFIGSIVLSATGAEMRIFHSADGKPLEASFEGMSGESVVLKREDGKIFSLPKDKLSAADQTSILQTAQRAGDQAKKLNTVAGHELTNGIRFSERKAEELAKTLGVRLESESKYGRSWRLYAARAKDYLMYLLAMVGESQAGGGTSIQTLLEGVRRQVFSKGRRIKEEDLKELRIRDFKRYIDEGIPVMWRMCSMEKYNEIANENTETREKVKDWKAHATDIAAAYASFADKSKEDSNHHVCMMIGYNEATQEIAVTDSWGPRFALRWVPVPVANWVSNGEIYMILP